LGKLLLDDLTLNIVLGNNSPKPVRKVKIITTTPTVIWMAMVLRFSLTNTAHQLLSYHHYKYQLKNTYQGNPYLDFDKNLL
jgi:hypothetical protein